MDFVALFPRGGAIHPMKNGSAFISYGSDGNVFVNSEGYVTGDRYAIKKLAMVFGKKAVPFTKVGDALLLNPPVCS